MRKIIILMSAAMLSYTGVAQERTVGFSDDDFRNYRAESMEGLNVFEPVKDTTSTPNDLKVKIGGAFALQFQAVDHENNGNVPLYDIGNNFNLATANFDLDVRLYDGINLHLRTYLSSRHHPEPYVKGGYITVDKLDFIQEGFLKNIMDYTTLKIGHMEINYGDAHFRRSDNAMALYNPFVGNYLMDSFTTEVGAEAYFQKDGFLGMVGVTNGRLNQNANTGTSPSVVAKLGYDKQINPDLRVRLTGSVYNTAHTERVYLYAGDRAGGRYYYVLEGADATSKGNFRSGRVDPGYDSKLTAFMINPFVKYQGLEIFGLYENTSGGNRGVEERRDYNQYAAEVIYRFGTNEKFYVGGRYNAVDGETALNEDIDVKRFNVGGGWYMTPNMMIKAEYVNQKHDGYNPDSIFADGEFDGVVAEAVIAF
ncbi:hypothetical protein GO491_05295 [Flavobacteriaceae bacterium Ap0902]|nr:hypothetical protein [Flavobacteriaceae bacterium Ap0902]